MNIEDTIRRQQFCQIKDQITGSDDYLVVGIDAAKDKHHAFMGSATGKSLLRRLVFENNLDGFRKLLEHIQAVKARAVVIEGGTHFVFAEKPEEVNRAIEDFLKTL
jgi:hypothetical protein